MNLMTPSTWCAAHTYTPSKRRTSTHPGGMFSLSSHTRTPLPLCFEEADNSKEKKDFTKTLPCVVEAVVAIQVTGCGGGGERRK